MSSAQTEALHEVSMSEDLTRFWSSMGRMFERDRPHHHHHMTPRHRSSSHASPWESLVAEGTQLSAVAENYVKGEDEKLSDDEGEDDLQYLESKLANCEIRSGRVLDGARIGDVPAKYVLRGLEDHELPVMGTFVDPSIVPGFCYSVRPADSNRELFQGQALRLVSVGMGYGKRITFASESHNVNDNYFWSDTHPEGYGFSLHLVQEGDEFTLRDANGTPVAAVKVTKRMGPQVEVSHCQLNNGCIEKRTRLTLLCDATFFDEARDDRKPLVITGVAVAVRSKNPRAIAKVKKIQDCCVDGERGYTLVAGSDTTSLITIVNGSKIGDIPTKYCITGLLPHELPVVGTYVDPRILTGFKYRVRRAGAKKHMFGGEALTLQAIGRGYGKRLTFASENLNDNENYFWSDSNQEGYGFSLQAVSPRDKFRIVSSTGENLGQAQVFRADLPQVEESCNISAEGHVTKRVRVTVTCDISVCGEEDLTLPVTGTAVLVRRGRLASVERLEDVAIGSQMTLLFRYAKETLIFVRD